MSLWEVLFFDLSACCRVRCFGGIKKLHFDAGFTKRKESFTTFDSVTDIVSPFPLSALFLQAKGAVRLFSSMLK